MRKTIYILLVLLSYTAYSQSLSVFSIDASNFPTIKAKFFAFDSTDYQILNLNPSDFIVRENGVERLVTNVSCPEPKPVEDISSVLVMDISSSMCDFGLDIGKIGAKVWVSMLPTSNSDCAITSFNNDNFINQDFTSNKTKLNLAIDNLICDGGTDFNSAMINAMAGGLLIAKSGKNKKIIVFITDGGMNSEPSTDEIIKTANADNISIYCITLAYAAPNCMKIFSDQTGGLCFENIRTKKEIEDCFRKILTVNYGGEPCSIEWTSGFSCVSEIINLAVNLIPNNLISNITYKFPNNSVSKLEIVPPFIKFNNAIPNKKKDTTIIVTARNENFNVTNITSSNPAYSVTPKSFFVASGQSQNLIVSYVPTDSGYAYAKFTMENDKCPTKYYATSGYMGKKAKIKTLKIIQPNGGETFIVGMDTLITWEGVLPEEKVKIEFTTDNGANWILIADSVLGLEYKWTIPKTPSNLCMARVTANIEYKYIGCDESEIQICSKVWMSHNLNVSTYRDGSPIREVKDTTEWSKLATGAWCHYYNDLDSGATYGKLYNWYAVNDPRGLAPEGWHIPTDEEWTELSDCLGGETVAGGKMKSTGTIETGDGLWLSPNTDATNESCFSAIPGGLRYYYGAFYGFGNYNGWWSSTENDSKVAWFRYIGYNSPILIRNRDYKGCGFSVRCVKD